MSWILLTNDDGPASPALIPFARALRRLGEVRVMVPDRERSWSSKAITRHDPVKTAEEEVLGENLITVTGFPADAVQVAYTYYDTPPGLVVSGINLGFNFTRPGVLASGTVGAAWEGRVLGIPSAAFSAEGEGNWREWHRFASSEESLPGWTRLAELCTGLLEHILAAGLPGDVVNVNVPWEAGPDTPRRLVPAAPLSYGQLHVRSPDGAFGHIYRADRQAMTEAKNTDAGVSLAREIAVTPIMFPHSPEWSDRQRRAIEQPDNPA